MSVLIIIDIYIIYTRRTKEKMSMLSDGGIGGKKTKGSMIKAFETAQRYKLKYRVMEQYGFLEEL